MALTGYEKLLKDYTKEQLIEIAESYSVYYTTSSGKGKLSGYRRLTKEQLVSIIKNDSDYIDANPKSPRRIDGKRLSNRLKDFKESLMGNESPEELMDGILSRLSGSERAYPSPGRYYTYIYYAVTPGILYDRHPLIMAGDILPKGFRGFNYHLGKIRQYNTVDGDRLVSGLFELSQQEFATLRSVPYGKLIQN
jgi:hypothetical protein